MTVWNCFTANEGERIMQNKCFRIGLVVGGIHLIAVLIFYGYIYFDPAMRSEFAWYWMIWFFIDFPVSLLVVTPLLSKLLGFNAVCLIVHGIVGSIWWGFIGFCVSHMVCKLVKARRFGRATNPNVIRPTSETNSPC